MSELDLSYEGTLREVETPQGVLKYHEAGDGPPLLLLHGSGPGVTGWRNFGENLATFAPHFRCLILEFPGFGVSAPSDLHPMMAAMPAVGQFMDALGIEKASIIGNSMGGVVGTRFAMAHPDRVERLVTVGGMGKNLFSSTPGEGLRLLGAFNDDPTRERLVQWLESMVFDKSLITEELVQARWDHATEPETLKSSRKMYSSAALEFMASIEAQSKEAPYWAMLHTVKCETLITWGRDDRVSPPDMALLPMRTIPKAELHMFPNCGHWTMIEAKDAWEAAVLAFLQRPERVSGY